jgi:hypothetical protein
MPPPIIPPRAIETATRRVNDCVVRSIITRELRRDEDLFAIDVGLTNRPAHCWFAAVDLCGIEVAVAGREGGGDSSLPLFVHIHAGGAEPECGQFLSLDGDVLHTLAVLPAGS